MDQLTSINVRCESTYGVNVLHQMALGANPNMKHTDI